MSGLFHDAGWHVDVSTVYCFDIGLYLSNRYLKAWVLSLKDYTQDTLDVSGVSQPSYMSILTGANPKKGGA